MKIKTKRQKLFFEYFVISLIVFTTLISTIYLNLTSKETRSTYQVQLQYTKKSLNSYTPKPDEKLYTKAEVALAEYNEAARIAAEREKMISEKVQKTISYLKKVKSPVANETIARILVEKAEENNADYRVLIAIMMIESGACRQSFAHNCFGYLNGVKYSSYEQAFTDLVPKISRQYARRYGWDFVSLSKAYGQHNWQLHSGNMLKVASSI